MKSVKAAIRAASSRAFIAVPAEGEAAEIALALADMAGVDFAGMDPAENRSGRNQAAREDRGSSDGSCFGAARRSGLRGAPTVSRRAGNSGRPSR